MAVLMEISVFSIHGEISKRKEVVSILQGFKQKGIVFELGAMGTSVECVDMKEALSVLEFATSCIDAKRYYVIAKFDCYKDREGMLAHRVDSVMREV